MEKLKTLMAEYGSVAIGVYVVIYAATMAFIVWGIVRGAGVESSAGIWATIAAAWVASRASMPIRLLATVAITPVVAKLLGRGKKAPPGTPQPDPPAPAK